MIKLYKLTFLLLVCLASGTIFAQQTFDVKKKNGGPVDLSSLHAKKVRYNATLKPGSPVTSNTFTRSRSFNSPLNIPHRILHTTRNAQPAFIETKRSHSSSSRVSTPTDLKTACTIYLKELQPLLKLDHPENDFSMQRSKTDANNITHVRLQQQYKGIPVYGAEIALHLNALGEGEAFNGKYLRLSDDLSIIPIVTELSAVERVKSQIVKGSSFKSLTPLEKSLVQYTTPKATLCIYENNGLVKAPTLTYHIIYCPSVFARWEYFIDAHTGSVLHHFNSVCSVDGPRTASANDLNGVSRTLNTYQKGATYFMIDTSRPMFDAASSTLPDQPVGGVFTIDLNNTFGQNQKFKQVTSSNNTWTNATAVSAHFNAGAAYNYYFTMHDRNGIDGGGSTIISVINVPDEDGGSLDNAFWNGAAMFYGNGNVAFSKLAGSMDVAGHEMTHGVVQNTANLEYQGESGAINESMADIFGTMMDPEDWLIGEDIVNPLAYPSGALRSLSDPHNGGTNLNDPNYQPTKVSEAYSGDEDNGGVHINSGIPNNAFFRFAEAITREKAAAVFYKALEDYLTKSSQFIDLRLAVIKAAGDLYGTSSNEVTQAGIAFDAVGITNGQGGNYTETLPANPGSEFLLVYSTDPNDPNSLYRASGLNATAISQTVFTSKPSVTDDGSAAVFVAGDHTIHVIITDPNETLEEFELQSETIWANAVISKGGNRLAAITTAKENVIHVYDFTTEEWQSFELYNPSPQYPDALEWDYTGEYLVYDAQNEITNSSGTSIEYWDVNFIHVWDIEAEDFSDGAIAGLFSSLPTGISIGNPSFAKTNPNIIAFDYIDDGAGEYAVLGMNIETNEVNVIANNNTLGWPSYNKNDSRIAFTIDNEEGNTKTGYVTLNSDKISSNGAVTDIFDLSSWPVYFSTGDRGVGGDEVTGILHDQQSVTLSCYPNPFTDELRLQLSQEFMRSRKIEIVNLFGQHIKTFSLDKITDRILSLDVHDLPPGQYILHIQNGKKTGSCKVVKLK